MDVWDPIAIFIVEYRSMSEEEEKDDGGRLIVQREVKVCHSTLSKHQRGRLGSETWEIGERRIRK